MTVYFTVFTFPNVTTPFHCHKRAPSVAYCHQWGSPSTTKVFIPLLQQQQSTLPPSGRHDVSGSVFVDTPILHALQAFEAIGPETNNSVDTAKFVTIVCNSTAWFRLSVITASPSLSLHTHYQCCETLDQCYLSFWNLCLYGSCSI